MGGPGPAARRVELAAADRGGVRERRDEPARLHPGGDARSPRDGSGCRSCRGTAPRAGAIRALVEFQVGRRRAPSPSAPPHPNRAKALRVLRGQSGPIDEARRREACWRCTACAARRSGPSRRRPRRGGCRPHDRVPGGGEGAGAGDPAQGQARRGAARVCATPADVEVAAAEVLAGRHDAPARGAPQVLVQQMVTRRRGPGGRGGRRSVRRRCITMRPGGALAEAGDAVVRAVPAHPEAGAGVRDRAGGALRARSGPPRPAGGGARPSKAIARAAHDLRGPAHLARGEPAAGERARRGRRGRARGSRAPA